MESIQAPKITVFNRFDYKNCRISFIHSILKEKHLTVNKKYICYDIFKEFDLKKWKKNFWKNFTKYKHYATHSTIRWENIESNKTKILTVKQNMLVFNFFLRILSKKLKENYLLKKFI